VAVKFAVVAPAATVTDAGTVNAVLLSDKFTELPPVGAAFDKVTVHAAVPPEVTVVGEHCNPETLGVEETNVTTLPVPERPMKLPSDKAPMTLVIGSEMELLLVEVSVTVNTATTPLAISLLFIPLARQVTEPLVGVQLSDLPAAVRTDPAATLTEATLLVG
jgi:hypothetical protein